MIINGIKITDEILEKLREEVKTLPFQPVFCDVLVGNNPASVQYVNIKAKRAEEIGIKFHKAIFDENIKTEDLILEIEKLNNIENICGLIVQLPLPEYIEKQKILDAINPKIDVDCIGTVNSDLFYSGQAYVEPPTALAIIEILESIKVDLTYKKFLVIGQGQLVGKPVTYLLKQKGYEVIAADINTENISELIKEVDVIITATGKANLINKENVKEGAIVIDAGTSENNGAIVGDVDFESVKDLVSFISPVPGGVGPVTVAKLLSNVIRVAKNKL